MPEETVTVELTEEEKAAAAAQTAQLAAEAAIASAHTQAAQVEANAAAQIAEAEEEIDEFEQEVNSWRAEMQGQSDARNAATEAALSEIRSQVETLKSDLTNSLLEIRTILQSLIPPPNVEETPVVEAVEVQPPQVPTPPAAVDDRPARKRRLI